MNFEKRMKKHIDATLEEVVPNPYPKKKAFPMWAKIALPVTSVALVSGIALGVVLPLSLPSRQGVNCFAVSPKAQSVKSLSDGIVGGVSGKVLQSLEPYFADPTNKNFVLSPASYQLAVASLAAVSEGFDLGNFGIKDAEVETKAMLEAWNFLYEKKDSYDPEYCRFDSGVLHQQVGPKYRFDPEKQKRVTSQYIATSVASLSDYHDQATAYFRDHVGLSIPIPDPELSGDGVIAYGAFKMKDSVPNGLRTSIRDFFLETKKIEVQSMVFGSLYFPAYVPYYDGDGYQVFQRNIKHTQMLIVLPDEGVNLESISIGEAFASFAANKKTVEAMGYVPYFHLRSVAVDLTNALANKLTGKEDLYAKLLSDGVIHDLRVSSVLQTSDFQFDRYGVAGESITTVTMLGSAISEEHKVVELNVDRPFYAISLKDGFPLFVNKVNDPSR